MPSAAILWIGGHTVGKSPSGIDRNDEIVGPYCVVAVKRRSGAPSLRFGPSGDRAAAIGILATMAFDGANRPFGPASSVEDHGEQTPEARAGVKLSDRNRRSRRIACDASLTPSTAPASAGFAPASEEPQPDATDRDHRHGAGLQPSEAFAESEHSDHRGEQHRGFAQGGNQRHR